jgi:hypothetical protein
MSTINNKALGSQLKKTFRAQTYFSLISHFPNALMDQSLPKFPILVPVPARVEQGPGNERMQMSWTCKG